MKKNSIDNLDTLEQYLAGNVLGLKLLDKVKFMEKTLQELKAEIEANGVVTTMPQGAYEIERANPAIAAYNAMIKNYNTAIKTLNEMLPDSLNSSDDFDKF